MSIALSRVQQKSREVTVTRILSKTIISGGSLTGSGHAILRCWLDGIEIFEFAQLWMGVPSPAHHSPPHSAVSFLVWAPLSYWPGPCGHLSLWTHRRHLLLCLLSSPLSSSKCLQRPLFCKDFRKFYRPKHWFLHSGNESKAGKLDFCKGAKGICFRESFWHICREIGK